MAGQGLRREHLEYRAVIFANYSSYVHPDIPNEPRVFGLRLKYPWGKSS